MERLPRQVRKTRSNTWPPSTLRSSPQTSSSVQPSTTATRKRQWPSTSASAVSAMNPAATEHTPALLLNHVTCAFASREKTGKRYTAVKDATLTVASGEFVSVVGPTGCGKSTLLNVAAGPLEPSSGHVRVLGAPLSGINRRAGYMFQAESLMPWRNARDNVLAGLQFAGVPEDES